MKPARSGLVKSLKLHWSLVDPSGLQGSEDVIAEAFRKTIGIVQARIETLLTHDLDSMAQQELAATFTALGEQ